MTAPQVDDIPPPFVRPDPMDAHEKMRIRAAAFRATRLYPGPVGKVLSAELLAIEEFGFRLGAGARGLELADVILKAPLP